MSGKIFIDTSIVIYALGQASTKVHLAAPLFVGSPSISTQVLSGAANVASKRLALSASEIRKLITSLDDDVPSGNYIVDHHPYRPRYSGAVQLFLV